MTCSSNEAQTETKTFQKGIETETYTDLSEGELHLVIEHRRLLTSAPPTRGNRQTK